MAKGVVYGGLNEKGVNNIKNIQRGSLTLTKGEYSKNVSVSAINTNKTVLLVSVRTKTSDSDPRENAVRGLILSDTSISVERYKASSDKLFTVDWVLMEFDNIKSFQSGQFSFGGYLTYSQKVSINTVNISKSVIFSSFCFDNDTLNVFLPSEPVVFFNANTLEISKFPSTNLYIRGTWYVIEFN